MKNNGKGIQDYIVCTDPCKAIVTTEDIQVYLLKINNENKKHVYTRIANALKAK